jgi:hypothetical protein
MEVNNRSVMPSSPYLGLENTALSINVGDVSPVVIKDRTGDNEAKVAIKGQEVTVKFDGPVPNEDRVLVEVKQQNEDGQLVLKPLSKGSAQPPAQTVDDLLKKAGFDPNSQPDLKEAVSLIILKGGSVSKDSLTNLQDFLKNDTGSLDEKLDTIRVMQQRNMEFTKEQLHAVNAALHGKTLTDSLSELMEGPIAITKSKATSQVYDNRSILERAIAQMKNDPERVLALLDPSSDQQLIADIKKALQIQVAGKEQILQAIFDSNLKEATQRESSLQDIVKMLDSTDIAANLSAAIQDAQKLDKIGNVRLVNALREVFTDNESIESPTNSAIQDITKLIQKEPSMEKVLDGVQAFIEENSALDVSGVKVANEKATQLTEAGREVAARKEIAMAISQLKESDQNLQKPHANQSLSKAEQYLINEAVQSLKLDSKNMLVTQITKKLSQMAIDFKQMKREMSRNLDAASKLMQGNKPGSTVPVKQMLDATITKLDKTILKSDSMLYTDMTTEKEMLKASSQLAEARNQLNKGNMTDANQIVKEVKDVVDKLMFKPSDNRVKHFISEQDLSTPKGMLEKAIHPFPDQDSGARRVFETIKSLGLTHEADSTQSLLNKQEVPHNLKSVLIQMLEADSSQSKLPMEQALANITGQQLLNKQDSTGVQNLFMQLPILLNEQVENIKVFVNSQKKDEKIDWENCSLYFVLETKKLGEVGISISAVNRNLSITFKNDQASFQGITEPLVETAKERLQEIGYNVGSLQFKPLNSGNGNGPVEKTSPTKAVFTEKGYDFTI